MAGPIISPVNPLTVRRRRIIRVRRNIDRLTPEQLQRFREAMQESYAFPYPDERGFQYWAGLHGAPLPIECQHNDELWLPWHRAYLYFFERSLRKMPGKGSVTQPWWRWGTGRLPAAYTEGTDEDNPLRRGPIPELAQDGSGDWTHRLGPPPGSLPTQQQVDDTLALTDFLDFSGSLRQLHNQVHGAINGSMGAVANAAFDPIFWAHHCYIDRLWRMWQQRNPGTQVPASLLDVALKPFAMTVKQTLSVTAMGYDYARSSISIRNTIGGPR